MLELPDFVYNQVTDFFFISIFADFLLELKQCSSFFCVITIDRIMRL